MKIGILCGIHEDIVNLKKAIDELEAKSCDTLICLGDIVGFTEPYYGHINTKDFHAVLSLVREKCEHIVIGNHDIVPTRVTPKQTLFAYPDNWYELSFEERRNQSNDAVWLCDDDIPIELTTEETDFLTSLPEFKVIKASEMNILISHYTYPNLVGDHIESDPTQDNGKTHLEFMRSNNCTLGIFNHDLQSGIRFFDSESVDERSFGKHELPKLPVAFNGSWVANGTEANGFMILDTKEKTVEAIPLNSIPHTVPNSH